MSRKFLLLIPILMYSCQGNSPNTEQVEISMPSINNLDTDSASFQKKINIDYLLPFSTISDHILLDDSLFQKSKSMKLSFDDYKKSRPTVTIDGVKTFVIQGDELYTEAELRDYWISSVYTQSQVFKLNTSIIDLSTSMSDIFQSNKMIVGLDTKRKPLTWPKGTVLKFSIVKNSFPIAQRTHQFSIVKSAFLTAGSDWHQLSKIKFEYHPEFEHLPDLKKIPTGLNFMILYTPSASTDDKEILATAFYKDQTQKPLVRVYPNYFETKNFDKTGIFRHEIGHILGFRHEHISRDAPADCKDESREFSRAITTYDYNSIMHYPCGKFNNYNLVFTRKDTLAVEEQYLR